MSNFLFILFSYALNLPNAEPNIQCTVVKVHKKEEIAGLKNFPQLYQSINNDPITSRLFIAGKEIPDINPESISKTSDSETISIKIGTGSIVLELNGKPISRNGFLKMNGKNIAEITCH